MDSHTSRKKSSKSTPDKSRKHYWTPNFTSSSISVTPNGQNLKYAEKQEQPQSSSGHSSIGRSMNKLIKDTLMNPNTGQWSRKNITCFVSFMWAIIYSGYGLYSEKDIQEFVVIGFLSLSAGLLGISSWEKKNL